VFYCSNHENFCKCYLETIFSRYICNNFLFSVVNRRVLSNCNQNVACKIVLFSFKYKNKCTFKRFNSSASSEFKKKLQMFLFIQLVFLIFVWRNCQRKLWIFLINKWWEFKSILCTTSDFFDYWKLISYLITFFVRIKLFYLIPSIF